MKAFFKGVVCVLDRTLQPVLNNDDDTDVMAGMHNIRPAGQMWQSFAVGGF